MFASFVTEVGSWHPHLILIGEVFFLFGKNWHTNAAELQEKCLFAFSCLDCSSAAVFHLLPVSWDMHKLNYFWGYSHNKARMSLHLSFVMWCNSLWENMYVLLHMETEVCLRSRFSHAVWSCLKRWEEEEEEPHPSSTELESVFSVISMERWFAFPREWLNIRWKREKERDQRNLLHSFGPEGANGKPANPKNSRDESANMNQVVIILLIVRWVKRENREMFWCLKKIEKCWKGDAPRSGGNSEKAWESQGKFSIIIVLKTFLKNNKNDSIQACLRPEDDSDRRLSLATAYRNDWSLPLWQVQRHAHIVWVMNSCWAKTEHSYKFTSKQRKTRL